MKVIGFDDDRLWNNRLDRLSIVRYFAAIGSLERGSDVHRGADVAREKKAGRPNGTLRRQQGPALIFRLAT
jgi:hypothetical protein